MNTRSHSCVVAGPSAFRAAERYAERHPRLLAPGVSHRRSSAAFTMIEIAIALGVIGFALVAIIGILPSGLQVQRDNRSETIINQDGTFWMEAIRNGPRGMDDLTNYVEQITTPERVFVFGAGGLGGGHFTSGADIISLLTSAVTNADPAVQVEAVVTAFSGSAAEKEYDQSAREMSFKYRMTVSITNAANTAVSFSSLAPPAPATVPL